MSGYGSIYAISYWGDVNATNGWGADYPPNAGGSSIKSDTTLFLADTTQIKADTT